MRMTVLICLSLIVIYSCKNKQETLEDKGRAIVRQYLKTRLHDPKSYESVEFYIDKQSVSYQFTDEGKDLRGKEIQYYAMINSEILPLQQNERDSLQHLLDSIKTVMANRITLPGWTISHTYRAKNTFGAMVLNVLALYLDSNFNITEVITDSHPPDAHE